MALERQKPLYVGFLCSSRYEHVVDEIIHEQGYQPGTWEKKVVDPWDIKTIHNATFDLATWFLAKNNVALNDIVVDVTAGLTTMSIAAFLTAEEMKLDTQYIRSEYDKDGKRIPNTECAILITKHTAVE